MNWLFNRECIRSYGQEGEDIILSKLFAAKLDKKKSSGFYVDIGAHHPKRFSNTYYFYKRGWRGINVDAMPGSMRAFIRSRPRDINIETAVSDIHTTEIYSAFEEPAYNGFHSSASQQKLVDEGVKLLWTKGLNTRRLDELLSEYLPKGQIIDFLSVDVEGHDLSVLKSMDWACHHPRVIVVEMSLRSVEEVFTHPTHQYLMGLGYAIYSKLCNSCIYISRSGD